MIDCGSQITICDIPVHFDNYLGCSHGCEYCFVKRKKDINNIRPINGSYKSLEKFINGIRNDDTNWCDWDIPIHWGGMSDPFQPIEQRYRSTLQCLKLFSETKYPVVISTKGKLCIDKKYINILSNCNVVMQVSCVSKYYDNIEKGAPTYNERLSMIKTLSNNVQRVVVRCQPYMPQVYEDVLKYSLNDFADAGAYGVIFEGMKYYKKPLNCKYELQRVGGDLCYDKRLLQEHFKRFKDASHALGMKFFVGENRLRQLGDSLCCCGCSDLFKVNTYNCNHLLNCDKQIPTQQMQVIGTGKVFHAIDQSKGVYEKQKMSTFEQMMLEQCVLKSTQRVLGKI